MNIFGHIIKLSRNLLLLALLTALAYSCNSGKPDKKYTIAFSQCQGADEWRKTMLDEMKRELAFHDNVAFIYRDAEADSKKQLEQIKELAKMKPDVLIVSPNEIQPLTGEIEKVFDSGIPVVLVDRGISSKKYTAFVGASNFEVGQNAGRYTTSLLKGKGDVIEVMGLSDATPFIQRHEGFKDIISKQPGIHYLKMLEDHEVDYEKHLATTLKTEKNIDVIFAESDYIALTVYKICKQAGLEKKIKIIGVDGLPSDSLGMGMVANKYIAATVMYPTGGLEAIQTAMNIIEGSPYQKEIKLATTIIDSSNVRILKLQNEKMLAQQNDIDRRQKKIEQQEIITNNQSTIIYTISISLTLALILGAILFYYLRENRKINKKLAAQNDEISRQRNQLIELSKKANAANEAKINFFTNISHEFRTPLTLILSPLEDLIANTKIHFSDKQHLTLIHKNVIRLLRLVNQLIDFRKIESDKMQIKASENDLVLFINEIVQSFKDTAKKRNIDLRVLTNERNINLWFDVSLLDKVIFNLLHNAFKFTKDNGYIHIALEKQANDGYVTIKVEDNGFGMSELTASHIFELFYQGYTNDNRGSGLGLALSKELIELHHGQITVSSKEGKGTSFLIKLPMGAAHLAGNEINVDTTQENPLYHDQTIYASESKTAESVKLIQEENKSDLSILIIEDNPDLLNYLTQTFSKEYLVYSADNGITGIRIAFDNVPDLIISDIMIPGKDGFEVTNLLKNDIRTSHIPVILLTAKQAIEKQIEGMKSKADAYIVKPFNLQFLQETIRSLMKNREILREHYTSEISPELKSQAPKKLDRKFINEFTSIIEANIPNEDFSVDFICSKIGISRVQLYRKVKSLLNINVNDYILNARLQKAKHYLSTGEFSISEIAFKVGFSSASYFSTVFKSKYGLTPKEFKEK